MASSLPRREGLLDIGDHLAVLIPKSCFPYYKDHGSTATGLGIHVFQVRRRGHEVAGHDGSPGLNPLARVYLRPSEFQIDIGQRYPVHQQGAKGGRSNQPSKPCRAGCRLVKKNGIALADAAGECFDQLLGNL